MHIQPNADNIRTILGLIPIDAANDEKSWWTIASAIAKLSGECGREPFREWSAQTHGGREDFDFQVDRAYERNQQLHGWDSLMDFCPALAFHEHWTVEEKWEREPVNGHKSMVTRQRRPPQIASKYFDVIAKKGEAIGIKKHFEDLPDATAKILSLFQPGDRLCSGSNTAVHPIPLEGEHKGPFICPNPLLTSRCDDEILRHQHVVVEFDTKTKTEQANFWCYLIEKGAPVVAIIDSGGKSLHAWLKVEENAASWKENVQGELYDGYLTPLGADRKCSNASRLSRLAGVVRPDTGKPQRLLYFNPDCPVGIDHMLKVFSEFTLSSIDFCDFEDDPKPLDWVIQDWFLQAPSLTMFTGKGGTGKSRVALQLAMSVAAGKPFLDLPVRHRVPVLMALCEDSKEVVAIRRWGIMQRQPDLAKAIDRGWLYILPRVGEQNAIGEQVAGKIVPGPFFHKLKAKLAAMGPQFKIVVLDTLMDVFHGEENNRTAVAQFCKEILFRMALDHNAHIMVLAHPAKAAESQYSGSTAWQGSIRMLWLLKEDEEREDVVNLSVEKSNYGKKPKMIPLRYYNGCYEIVDEAKLDEEGKTAVCKFIIDMAAQDIHFKLGSGVGGNPRLQDQEIMDPFSEEPMSSELISRLALELVNEGIIEVRKRHNLQCLEVMCDARDELEDEEL